MLEIPEKNVYYLEKSSLLFLFCNWPERLLGWIHDTLQRWEFHIHTFSLADITIGYKNSSEIHPKCALHGSSMSVIFESQFLSQWKSNQIDLRWCAFEVRSTTKKCTSSFHSFMPLREASVRFANTSCVVYEKCLRIRECVNRSAQFS